MSRPQSLRMLPWLAVGGLLAGHAAASSLTASHAAGAGPELHAYLGWASRVGALVAVLGLTSIGIGQLIMRDRVLPSFAAVASRLVVLQAGAFVVMEVAERAMVHAPLTDLSTMLPVGLAAQVAVALVLATLLRWLLATGDRVPSLPGRIAFPRLPEVDWPVVERQWSPASSASAPAGARAPPV